MQTLSFNRQPAPADAPLHWHPPTPARPDMLFGKAFLVIARSALGAACCASFLLGGPALHAASAAQPHPPAALSPADDQLLDEIEHAGFKFFVEQAHPRTGLGRDRARAHGSASEGKARVAASGFSFNAS